MTSINSSGDGDPKVRRDDVAEAIIEVQLPNGNEVGFTDAHSINNNNNNSIESLEHRLHTESHSEVEMLKVQTSFSPGGVAFGMQTGMNHSWSGASVRSNNNEDPSYGTNDLYDYNISVPEMFHPSSYERGFHTSANVGIFLCTLGIFFNILIIALLLSSKRLRFHYLYLQILNIAVADLGFVVMVDSFTVYFELQPWDLGAAFCITYMLLDVVLPSVALLGLLFLNIDRVLFAYKTTLYHNLIQRTVSRVLTILMPWCLSGTIVCGLWLGFPEVEPQPGMCVYGITEQANVASSWLTVFVPSLLILVLLTFGFIAAIGEMPVSGHMHPLQYNTHDNVIPPSNMANRANILQGGREPTAAAAALGITLPTASAMPASGISHSRRQRQFMTALLTVDFISLAITLPFPAFSMMQPSCDDPQSCESLRSLFQTLAWMRSSIACIRPVLFILLTDIYQSFKQRLANLYLGRGFTDELSVELMDQERHNVTRYPSTAIRQEMASMSLPKNAFHTCSRNNSTVTTYMTPPQSPAPHLNNEHCDQSGENVTSVCVQNEEKGATFV